MPNSPLKEGVAEVEEGVDRVGRRRSLGLPLPFASDESRLGPDAIDNLRVLDPVGDGRPSLPAHQVGDGLCGRTGPDLSLDWLRGAGVESLEKPKQFYRLRELDLQNRAGDLSALSWVVVGCELSELQLPRNGTARE